MKFLRRTRLASAGVLCAFVLIVPGGAPRAFSATELIVADPAAGTAIYGFDPVSYFLLGRAEMGSQNVQLKFAGVTWQFRSEANREAFRAQPDVYVPRFGGYDAVALKRGAPVAGHPTLFVIHDGRLYLFQKPENREAFIAAPQTAIEAARSFWPDARRSLVH
jgi:YHS domain-containing protein